MSRLTVFTRRLFYEKSKKISNNRLCHCDADVYISYSCKCSYHTFSWEGTTRYAHVNTVWRKGDNSATYFRVTDNSMPVEGFYIRTTLAPYGGTRSPSSYYYKVTTYGGKTIKHNKYAKNLMAGLETYYPATHWSWGNVSIAWSEDYVEDGSERLNW